MPEHNHITRGDVTGCPSCDVREGRAPDPMYIPAPTPPWEHGPVLPPLTAKDFEMRWDAEHVFPFVEDEDATIMAYGHHDPATFVQQVFEYDRLVIGGEFADEPMDTGDVRHFWAVRVDEGNPEDGWWMTWGGITQDTEHAFPVTVIVR